VSHTLLSLKNEGFEVVEIPTRDGVFDMDAYLSALTPKTVLVTVMAVNNETGALYPLKQIADAAHRASPDAAVHIDATQSFMKIPFTPKSIGADMITVSSHKIEGPKGVGALWVADTLLKQRGLSPMLLGGGQEGGLRSGTENVPGACAFAEAARVYSAKFAERHAKMLSLRTYLLSRLSDSDALADVTPNLPKAESAPHICSLTVRGMESETVLNDLSGRGIYVSSGSACSSHDQALSGALLAFGKTEDEADSTVRVSFSYRNTEAEIDTLLSALAEILATRAKK
jgi:cysteine desulfurase